MKFVSLLKVRHLRSKKQISKFQVNDKLDKKAEILIVYHKRLTYSINHLAMTKNLVAIMDQHCCTQVYMRLLVYLT